MLQKQNVTTIRIMKTKNDRLCFSGKGVVSTRNSFHMENDISSCQIERNLQTVFEMANFSLEKSSSSSISVIFAILYDASQKCPIRQFSLSYLLLSKECRHGGLHFQNRSAILSLLMFFLSLMQVKISILFGRVEYMFYFCAVIYFFQTPFCLSRKLYAQHSSNQNCNGTIQ